MASMASIRRVFLMAGLYNRWLETRSNSRAMSPRTCQHEETQKRTVQSWVLFRNWILPGLLGTMNQAIWMGYLPLVVFFMARGIFLMAQLRGDCQITEVFQVRLEKSHSLQIRGFYHERLVLHHGHHGEKTSWNGDIWPNSYQIRSFLGLQVIQ